jgi:putative ABC transport system ATP-binding protein
MIRLEGVRFQYGRGGFSLEIGRWTAAAGEHVAVVGPSGCGKTTLLHLLAGIRTPEAGEVHMGDVCVSSLGDADRRRFRITSVGLVFQEFELLDYLTVRENILLPYRLHPALSLRRADRDRVEALADALGIRDKLARGIDSLSQGERQRAAICRAVAPEPKYLLADEPTGNLDPSRKRQAMDLLRDQARRTSATLVVVTHDYSLLDAFDRVVDLESIARSAVA